MRSGVAGSLKRLTIDGIAREVAPDVTVLEAIRAAGGDVPTLCYDPRQAPFGACRVCLVGIDGSPRPIVACTTPCRDGMVIRTDDPAAREAATAIVELILSELPAYPDAHTELAQVAAGLGLTAQTPVRWPGEQHPPELDDRHPYLAFRHELCISCGRCVRACDEVQGAFALTVTGRGFHANVTAGLDAGFRDSSCVSCGACADTCPTDAITEVTLL
jgi:predicted molibdopterin-dependent oxidoreductase YjgC